MSVNEGTPMECSRCGTTENVRQHKHSIAEIDTVPMCDDCDREVSR